MSQLKAGEKLQLKNKYEIESLLGDGGFGSVFKAKNLKTMSTAAIKIFKSEAFTSPAECRMYWERESKLTESAASYPGRKMEYLEASEDKTDRNNPKFYIVLGFVKGTTLKAWFNDNLRAPEKDRISVDDMIKKIFVPLCDFMHFAHSKGAIHRDFTFNNIMICKDEKTGEVYPIVIDWGGGKEFDPVLLTQEPPKIEDMPGQGTVIITPGFFAPEVIMQKPPLPQTDIYMFGAVLFYALTNGYTRVKPTVASDYILHPQDYNMNISDTLNDIVQKCTQFEPRDRFRTFAEIKVALEQHLSGNVSGLDQLPTLATGNSFVFHVLNNDAIIQLNPYDMVLEEGKNLRFGRELMINSAGWDENYKGVFRGVTRCQKDGKDQPREQFFLGYSKGQNLFYIHEGRNSNPTIVDNQRIPPGQWVPVQVGQAITVQSTTVKGLFELIQVLDTKPKK